MTATRKKPADERLLKKVARAIGDIEQSGQRPTLQRIHELVGGSFRDLCPAVRVAKERLEQQRRQTQTVPEMPDHVRALFEEAWVQLYRYADEEGTVARKSFAEELGRMEEQIAEREAALCAMEAAKEESDAALRAELQKSLDARTECAKLSQSMVAFERDLLVARARLEERDALVTALTARSPVGTTGKAP